MFGAKFVALNQGIETLRSIRYKLPMMGVSISALATFMGIPCPSSTTQQNKSLF